jgi:hypothetical protein
VLLRRMRSQVGRTAFDPQPRAQFAFERRTRDGKGSLDPIVSKPPNPLLRMFNRRPHVTFCPWNVPRYGSSPFESSWGWSSPSRAERIFLSPNRERLCESLASAVCWPCWSPELTFKVARDRSKGKACRRGTPAIDRFSASSVSRLACFSTCSSSKLRERHTKNRVHTTSNTERNLAPSVDLCVSLREEKASLLGGIACRRSSKG